MIRSVRKRAGGVVEVAPRTYTSPCLIYIYPHYSLLQARFSEGTSDGQ